MRIMKRGLGKWNSGRQGQWIEGRSALSMCDSAWPGSADVGAREGAKGRLCFQWFGGKRDFFPLRVGVSSPCSQTPVKSGLCLAPYARIHCILIRDINGDTETI